MDNKTLKTTQKALSHVRNVKKISTLTQAIQMHLLQTHLKSRYLVSFLPIDEKIVFKYHPHHLRLIWND